MKIKTKLLKLLISFALCIIIWTSSDGFSIVHIDFGNYDKEVSVFHDNGSGADVSDDLTI